MRILAALAVVAALLISPAAALAGAPNYDCLAGAKARLSVDQWADVVAAAGFQPGPVVWGTASHVDQDGGSLDLVAGLHGQAWDVSIRGGGTSLRIDTPAGKLRGICAFVPGSYVLRTADAGGSVLRAGPSSRARRLLAVPRGSAVWEVPFREQVGHWIFMRAFVARNGAIRAVDGWLQQHKPREPRCTGAPASPRCG